MPDQLWEKIEPILKEHDPSKNTGRPRVNQRAVLDAVIFRLRTGCQWNRLPSEFPDDSSVHRTFQRWVELGILGLVWASLLKECEELKGVTWEWQAADGRWARRVLGGSRGPEPRRSSQNRREALSVGRGRWRTARGGGGGSERARRQAARSHAGCGSGQASRTYRGIVPTPVFGQWLRQPADEGTCGRAKLRPPHSTDRRGEARRGRREALPGEAVGGGAHAGLAFEVPVYLGTL